jgi:hypothetical protein
VVSGFLREQKRPDVSDRANEVQRLWMFRVFQILVPEETIRKSQEAVWRRDIPASFSHLRTLFAKLLPSV